MANNLQVRDAIGNLVSMATTEMAGVHYARQAGYDAQDDMMKVKSNQSKFRESFSRTLTENWDIIDDGGILPTISGGVLSMNSTTVAGAYAEILSKQTFTVPFRVMAGVMNTRHANNHQIVEMISVDPVTLQPDGLNSIQIDIGGAASATATQMKYAVQNNGIRPLESAVSNIVSTAGYSILEMEPTADEAYWHSRAIDSTAARGNSYVRHTVIPDPNAIYKIRIRSMNYQAWKNTNDCVAGTGGLVRINSPAHGFATGNKVWVESLAGVLNAGSLMRGSFIITVIDANNFDLQGTVFSGAYGAGSGRVALAAAPTAVLMNVQFISCNDYAELTAEITAGRGQSVDGQAMGVRVTGGSVGVSGAVNNNDNIWYQESIAAQAAGATLLGATRDTGAASAANTRYAYFNAFVFSNQAGTLNIQVSHDNVTWFLAATVPVTSSPVGAFLRIPVIARYARVQYINGATANTQFLLTTSYSAA